MNFRFLGMLMFMSFYLKAGIGAPWAGHSKANWDIEVLSNRLSFVSLENLGAEPPMGSK